MIENEKLFFNREIEIMFELNWANRQKVKEILKKVENSHLIVIF